MAFQDYRAVPLEVLRDFTRSQTGVTSIRQVADEVGVGRSTLHKFILGRTSPQPRVRRLLALWYLETIKTAHHIDLIRPYVSALETLIAPVPNAYRDGTVASILTALESGCGAGGEALPDWLPVLRRALA